jgi:hypothetical protein
MKYYIVGKNSIEGPTHDTSGNLNSYYELGWEIMVTHYKIKKMLYDNLIDAEDVIVTSNEDRIFLYKKNFENVISWENFKNLVYNSTTVPDQDEYIVYTPEIDNLELKSILTSFLEGEDIKSKTQNTKYVCLQFRKRDWCAVRNVDEGFFSDLIKFFSQELKIDVYIMGIGAEIFCDNEKIFYVNLQEFTTLINNDNCLFFYSSMSGPAHLSYFFGKKNLYHLVNSVSGPRPEHLKNHPLYMGDIYNYTNVDVEIIPHHQSIETIKKHLKNKNIF